MEVSDPKRDVPERQYALDWVDFVANLIVLDSKGIDVNFLIDWLSKHRVPIECTHFPGLMVYLINFMVRVCSLRSIFDQDRTSWGYENITF
jgi:hypothetical protein